MTGIMPQAKPDQPDDVVADDDDGNATPEEQAQYDELVTTGFELLYKGGKVRDGILEMLDEDSSDLKEIFGKLSEEWDQPDPDDEQGRTLWETQQRVIALAATLTVVVLEAVQRTGTDDGSVILHAGKELIEDLAQLAHVAEVYDYSDEEVSEAFRKAADLYREAAASAGLIDKDAVAAEFQEIVKADKEGRLGDVLGTPKDEPAGEQDAPASEPEPEAEPVVQPAPEEEEEEDGVRR